jgi:hypothetical protein
MSAHHFSTTCSSFWTAQKALGRCGGSLFSYVKVVLSQAGEEHYF